MIKVPGFDGNRLVVQGMADSQPLVPNNSPENRRMNRRVEIAIMQGKPTVSAPIGALRIPSSFRREARSPRRG